MMCGAVDPSSGMSRHVSPAVESPADRRRYRTHAYLLVLGVLGYAVSMLVVARWHTLLMVASGGLVVTSGAVGIAIGRNALLQTLVDFIEVDPARPGARRGIHRHLANAISGVYVLLGLWWIVMGAWWWLL